MLYMLNAHLYAMFRKSIYSNFRVRQKKAVNGDRESAVFIPIRIVVSVASVCHPAYIQLTIANNLSSCLVSVMLSNKNIAYIRWQQSKTEATGHTPNKSE